MKLNAWVKLELNGHDVEQKNKTMRIASENTTQHKNTDPLDAPPPSDLSQAKEQMITVLPALFSTEPAKQKDWVEKYFKIGKGDSKDTLVPDSIKTIQVKDSAKNSVRYMQFERKITDKDGKEGTYIFHISDFKGGQMMVTAVGENLVNGTLSTGSGGKALGAIFIAQDPTYADKQKTAFGKFMKTEDPNELKGLPKPVVVSFDASDGVQRTSGTFTPNESRSGGGQVAYKEPSSGLDITVSIAGFNEALRGEKDELSTVIDNNTVKREITPR